MQDGLFSENTIAVLVEASKCASIDMASSFLSAVIDWCCAKSTAPFVTALFNQYTMFRNYLNCQTCTMVGWQKSSILRWYQSSSLNETRENMLEQVTHNIKILGGVWYMIVEFYEKSHKLLRKCFRETKNPFSAISNQWVLYCQERKLIPDVWLVSTSSLRVNDSKQLQ